MSAQNPKEALDAFVGRFRRAIQCVAAAEVRGSGHVVGQLNSITLIPRGARPSNVVPLRTADGRRDLLLGLHHHYTVIHLPDDPAGGPFKVSSSRYIYEVLDRDERELFVYHWHPEGVSPIQVPHMHFSGAAPISLPPAPGDQQPRRLEVDRAHFPTGRIALEEVIQLLIRDLGIAPRGNDWEGVLNDSLAALRSRRPWE